MNIPSEKIIDIRELRIGNYLLYDGKIVHVTFLSMDIDDEYEESIGFCDLGKTTNEKADWNRALCDKLDRIPVTAEWLGKFGGEKLVGLPFYEIDMKKNIGQISVNPDNGVVFLRHHRNNNTSLNPMSGDPYYIHQLQNLYYALTGEELTIKELQP